MLEWKAFHGGGILWGWEGEAAWSSYRRGGGGDKRGWEVAEPGPAGYGWYCRSHTPVGGEVPARAEIERGDTDMTDVLTEFAAVGPDAIFFPLFVTEGSALAAQARAFDGLEGTTLISAAALLVSAFLGTPQSEGMYFAGPQSDFGSNVNELTGRSGEQVLAAYEARHGGFPLSPYWAHAYEPVGGPQRQSSPKSRPGSAPGGSDLRE